MATEKQFDQTVRFLIKAGVIVGSGGLIFGYDIGVIAGTIHQLDEEFHFTDVTEGLVVSILYLGSVLGSIIGGPLCDSWGRWKTIQFQNVLFVIGAVITGMAQNIEMLCVGRFIVGIASAVSGIADVPYLTEISPPQYRGLLSSQYEMSVSIGVLISFGLDLAFSGVHDGWRIAFMLPAAFVVLQSSCLFLLPESPKWLIEKGYFPEARRTLSLIYGEDIFGPNGSTDAPNTSVDVDGSNIRKHLVPNDEFTGANSDGDGVSSSEKAAHADCNIDNNGSSSNDHGNDGSELQEYIVKLHVGEQLMRERSRTISDNNNNSDSSGPAGSSGKDNQTVADDATRLVPRESEIAAAAAHERNLMREYSYAIYIIIAVQVLAQITGGNVIRNYAATIFENGGVSTTLSLVYNLVLGVIKAIFTFISIMFIDGTGRLKLLMLSIITVGFGMLFLTLGSSASASGNISNVGTYMVGCSLVFAGFGLGYGPVPWVLSSEMFPTVIRGRIMSISLIASNVAQLVVNFLFLPMVSGLTTAGAFACYFLLNVFTLWFTISFLVESKAINPPEILTKLQARYDQTISQLQRYCCCCCCCETFSQQHQRGVSTREHETEASSVELSRSGQNSQTLADVESALHAGNSRSTGAVTTQH